MENEGVMSSTKKMKVNTDLSWIANFATIVVSFLVGVSYNFFNEALISTVNDMGTYAGSVSFIYIIPISTAFVNFLTVVTTLISFNSFQKYPLFYFVCFSLVGQFILCSLIEGVLPLVYSADTIDDKNGVELAIAEMSSIAHGFLSAFNMLSFLHISSLISWIHLLFYLLGVGCGPFLSSMMDYIGFMLGGSKTEVDYYVMMSVLLVVEVVAFVMVLTVYFTFKSFREAIKIEPTNLLEQSVALSSSRSFKAKVLLRSALSEMRDVIVNLKYNVLTIVITAFTTATLYPGLFNYYPIGASRQTSTDYGNYSFVMKNISIVFTGGVFLGTVFIFIPYIPSKKVLFAFSVFSSVFLCFLVPTFSQFTMFVLNKYPEESNGLGGQVRQVSFILLIFMSAFGGIFQGYSFSATSLAILKHAEERVAVGIILASSSFGTLIGSIVQIMLLFSFNEFC
ncbi:hypothetical protein EIN_060120 [Entamoeba invadens IP1]|uniref:hypothetical protein n=1 Tax=Entamoeba invadens IP1 TaxID=370355 RepID=UPI0002C3F050|nr:hypothetical protein EIN_060120 [Entamoeba invadens IP1]ELP93497.1 hypothetical protein EIN_060120 [Entamoeba invadens IP1]|eukprot:XP_004260268.1 hypothetical protein EIN_060120 [Entamoeba invadens IP1]